MRGFIFLLFFMVCNVLPLFPQTKIIIEFSTGLPLNIPMPLTISQTGQKDISLTARFTSEPLVIPIYWDWRISYCKDKWAWELESIHHKLFLENNPPEIGTFSISHGLNFVIINRSLDDGLFIYRAGIGFILAHPESIIRNKIFQESGGLFNWGYFFTGPAIILGANKRLNISGNLFANIEFKLSAAYISVPVSDGNAELYNVALHLNFGLGYSIYL